jgi:adenylate cyclase
MAYAGEADRAIEWAERALRVSPLDQLNYFAFHALAIGNLQRGRYEDAANAGRRAVQSMPSFSVSHCLLAAALAKLGHTQEAKAVAARVMSLLPSFSSSGFCAALETPSVLTEIFTGAWHEAGLPP